MHRVFVSQDQLPIISGLSRTAMVRGSDVHYIKDVLRLQAGAELELLDGTGKTYLAKISEIKQDKIVCEILESTSHEPRATTRVTLAQCLPKAKKMSLIIQKCTELGVDKIIPTLSERSIAKGDKQGRWLKIAKEAAEQSGRSTIPQIDQLTKFDDVLKLGQDFDLALIPWELAKETTLKQVLKEKQPKNLLILIGPEGGFSQKEIDLAKQAGFTPITLGKRILRTETAGLALMAMLNYALE